jgi:hypothetical protein
MKKSKNATSIIEAIIILLIITSWVTWMYTIFNKSTKLSSSIENKIYWIEIARQWIEAITNIRDTNWLRFSSNDDDCWNTLNYNNNCITDSSTTTDISAWSYIIYKKNDNVWYLESKTTWTFWVSPYNDNFKVWLDNWIYTQSWITNKLLPRFTREIKVSYLDLSWNIGDSNDKKMKVISLVTWADSSSTKPHKIKLEQILTNWKK